MNQPSHSGLLEGASIRTALRGGEEFRHSVNEADEHQVLREDSD
jgi:hypothetical protein